MSNLVFAIIFCVSNFLLFFISNLAISYTQLISYLEEEHAKEELIKAIPLYFKISLGISVVSSVLVYFIIGA